MCYLDESGVPESTGTSHFVLVGLAIPAEQWKVFDRQVSVCKDSFGLREAEIHAAWMARRYVEQEQIANFASMSRAARRTAVLEKRDEALIRVSARRNTAVLKEKKKNYHKTESYIHLTLDERLQALFDLATIVGGWNSARLFAEAIDKSAVYCSTGHRYTPFEFAFRELVQRYEYFLRHRGNAINQTLIGMLVQDNNETMARRLTEMMRRFHDTGTGWVDIDHIIETPLFVDSHLTSMVQMADLCGYATRASRGSQRYAAAYALGQMGRNVDQWDKSVYTELQSQLTRAKSSAAERAEKDRRLRILEDAMQAVRPSL
jgi:hypothetical protein